MCRLYGFRSSVLSGVHQSLVAAENALAEQSNRHPDGWGVAYYVARFPHLVRSSKKALADGLFKEVSAVVSTRTLLAHIRQATVGKVGILNCHPFQHGPWSFAHNGEIATFGADRELRHAVRALVDQRFHPFVLGNTDSETIFYVFLSRLGRKVEDIYHAGVGVTEALVALKETVDLITQVSPDFDGKGEPTKLTVMVTNGSLLIGYRHRRELLYSTYKTHCAEQNSCHAYEPDKCEHEVKSGIVKHLIVTSEHISQNPNVWMELQDGEFVCVDHGMTFNRGWLKDLGSLRRRRLAVHSKD